MRLINWNFVSRALLLWLAVSAALAQNDSTTALSEPGADVVTTTVPAPLIVPVPQLYSIGTPSADQQYMLELINRARANGTAEAARLGLSGLQEGPPKIAGEPWLIQNTVQPLSWNTFLTNAAQGQANRLNNADQFFLGGSPHTFGGMTPQQRIAASGYSAAPYSGSTTTSGFFPGPENVAEAVSRGFGGYTGASLTAALLDAHNNLFTDLSVPGRGHRSTTMLSFFREVGIGISVGTDVGSGATWDSLYLVQDFGTKSGSTPFVTGVVYQDVNYDGFYNPGEGLGGVAVSITGTNYYAVTSLSGGYSVPVPGNGTYTVTFSGPPLPATQRTAIVTGNQNVKVDLVPGSATLGNISTRLRVEKGDNVLIGGFIVTGTQPKKVIVRAIGPSLQSNGTPVAGRLANPTLELYRGQTLLASNDNWQESPEKQAIIDSTVRPSHPLESAIVVMLPANSTDYTAIVRGAGGGTGVGLVEVYDLDLMVDSKLANISSRGFVQTGDNVMIGGFIISGASSKKVIVRAIGPSLFVPGKLSNPNLELFNRDGVLVASNDNWRTGGQEAEIVASTVPPTNDLESAIVATLPPTPHTAIVRGANGTSGVGLVEVYALD